MIINDISWLIASLPGICLIGLCFFVNISKRIIAHYVPPIINDFAIISIESLRHRILQLEEHIEITNLESIENRPLIRINNNPIIYGNGNGYGKGDGSGFGSGSGVGFGNG